MSNVTELLTMIDNLTAQIADLQQQLEIARTGKALQQLEVEQFAAAELIANLIDLVNSSDTAPYTKISDDWWTSRIKRIADTFIDARSDAFSLSQVYAKECRCS